MTHPLDQGLLDEWLRTAQAERGRLAAIARSEGLTPEDAVDCVQDALCTLLDLVRTGQLESVTNPAPLLTTIVRNAARNDRRRHFRARPHEAIDAVELADREAPFADDLLARAVDRLRLRACVAELCEIQRAVVTLRILEERPGEDVAALLGITKNHAAVLLHRAGASLRACMSADDIQRTGHPAIASTEASGVMK
jgi:RNA polymerase sigma-70 factor (ECF subfamily)